MPDLETHHLTDDGDIPNNAHLPLILYRRALDVQAEDAERRFEELFKTNGWGGSWVDSVYPFHHYHSTAHEVLGIARGRVRVQFGGRNGPTLDVDAGDAVFIPAGVGHCRIGGDAGLAVVGAYPEGQDWDLRREGDTDRESIRSAIARVPLPERDPVLGTAFLSHPFAKP